jgi:O-antigen ligase
MLNRLSTILGIPGDHPQRLLFGGLAVMSMLLIWAGIGFQAWWLLGVPAVLAVLWLTAVDFRRVFFLMIACLPLSIETELPGGFSTDFPSEQLMWLLTLCGVGWLLRNARAVDGRFVRHPLTIGLILHLIWISISVLTSQDVYVSFKYLLAKGWYVIVFYCLAAHLLRTERDFKEFFWWFLIPLLIAVLSVFIRHAAINFSFQDVAYVMGPFFRNHVMYACLLAIFLPFIWYATYWYRRWSKVWWFLVITIAFLLVAINFAYTRAAYVALAAAVGIYWIMRWRLMKMALLGFALVLGIFISFVGTSDNWLEFAPDYEKAITHTRFDNLLEATTKLEDISTMERVYRWVAATYMIKEKPITGFGPGNFYFYYTKYTVSSFKTYVSDNPEHSGIHNYYLMTAVEQGLPGMVIFILFSVLVMLYGERVFHRAPPGWRRRMVTASVMCFILIDLLMLMNDLVETDKIGSLFFVSVAMLVNLDLMNRSGVEG